MRILRSGLATLALVPLLVGCGGSEAPELDLLVVGGTVVDGSGQPRRRADVGVRDGRIAFVGDGADVQAADTLDAAGLVVAPGFIDVHNHTAPAIADSARRWNEGVLRQGVTTIVGGPDGGLGPWDIAKLVQAYEANGVGTNVAFYVGHNAIRRRVLGEGADRRRPPTAAELEEMRGYVREGMEMGAVGLSTGLMYDPGMFSETDEVVALAEEVAPYHGVYDSHVRNPVHELLDSDREVVEIAERAGVPGKIAHIKAVGLRNEGLSQEVIRLVEDARARGLDIVTDQYPYDGAATSDLVGLIVVPPALEGELAGLGTRGGERDPGAIAALKQALADRAKRAALKEASEHGVDGGFAWLKATGYESMRITASEDYPELVGAYLSELARERGSDPFDVVSELILGAENRVSITLGAIMEDDVRRIMVQPWNMIASDGGYTDGSDRGVGHPRSAGTFPRLLGHYVRDEGVVGLEEAVRKITSFPAEFLRLEGRGRIRASYWADIAVFDPERIAERSDWVHPQRFAQGVVHVLVNGFPTIRNGSLARGTAGRVLRRGGSDGEES